MRKFITFYKCSTLYKVKKNKLHNTLFVLETSMGVKMNVQNDEYVPFIEALDLYVLISFFLVFQKSNFLII